MKRVLCFIVAIMMLPTLTGCEYEKEIIPEDKETVRLSIESGTKKSFTHIIEEIDVITSYDTNGYDLSNWLITDGKMISYSVVLGEPTDTEILLEHTHLDIRLKSTSPLLNGMVQDSMDDSYHGYDQDGFLISDKYSYNEIFSIDGYSDKLISGWGFYCGSYGSASVTEKRLDESTLRKAGTYGSELTVVYNLSIKHKGETLYHSVPISDKIIIPVNPDWKPSTEIVKVF